jgi:predicted Rossmann fold flavoprotein
MSTYDVIIAGGGAAGLFAAARLAELAPALRILVLEKGQRPLAKVRISGGGRCNLTHQCKDIRAFTQNYPRGGRELIGAFHRFGPAETMAWFESHGVPLVTLEDGCVFPRSDTSLDVINALLDTARSGQTEIRTSSGVSRVRPLNGAFEVSIGDHGRETCRRLLVTTGGGAFIEGLDHTIEPCVPSLFAFNTPDRELTSLAGIVVEAVQLSARTSLDGRSGIMAEGELLITHTGVSGPAVLRLSSFGARGLAETGYRFDMRINWQAGLREDQVCERLAAHKRSAPRQQLGTWSPLGLPARLWKLLLQRAGANETGEWGGCPLTMVRRIAAQATAFSLPIAGKNRHREEFVTCGGIRLKEIDFRTMESRLHPGLFVAGEVLDIDALTGGYNLQAAWTTGAIAAEAMLADQADD